MNSQISTRTGTSAGGCGCGGGAHARSGSAFSTGPASSGAAVKTRGCGCGGSCAGQCGGTCGCTSAGVAGLSAYVRPRFFGGMLLIPALNLLGGLVIQKAMATALFTFIFTGAAGTWLFARRGSIDWKVAVPVCLGAAPFEEQWTVGQSLTAEAAVELSLQTPS